MLSINTNMTSLLAMKALNGNTNAMNIAMNRLSTGYRINSSKDDAAGSAISANLSKEISSFDVAQDNAQMGQSMIDTASATLDNIRSMVQRIRALAVESANGTYGDEERKAMQEEVGALVDEIYRIKNTTEFNGKKIFGAEAQPVEDTAEQDAIAKGYTIVKTAEEFKNAFKINDADCKIMLFADIDLSELEADANGSNWTAVGTDESHAFMGILDGNSFSISNLKINEPTKNNQGLFGYIKDATLENVVLKDVDIKGQKKTGGIVGYAKDSELNKCTVSGKVNASGMEAGGLVGCSDNTTISNSSSSADVTGVKYVGGLVGRASGSEISDCDVTGDVTGSDMHIGGLVGELEDSSSVDNCSSYATVTGSNDYVGGLVGFVNGASVTNSTSAATVTTDGGNNIGGLAGSIGNSSTVEKCLSEATVSGVGTGVGGFAGEIVNSSNVSESSSFATVNGTGVATGGFVGLLHGESSVSNSNSNSTVTGAGETGGFVGNMYETSHVENCSSTGSVTGTTRVGGFVGISDTAASIDNSSTTATVTGTSDKGAFGGALTNDSSASGNEYNSTINGGLNPVGTGIDPTAGQVKDDTSLVITPEKKGGSHRSDDPDSGSSGHISTSIKLQVGINNDANSNITVDTGFEIGEFRINVETEEDAVKSIETIDTLMYKITNKQTELGAASNRLQSTMDFQQVQKDTKIAVLSVIKDADMAKESSDYIKSQILQQTTASLLSQANQTPSIALRLLSV